MGKGKGEGEGRGSEKGRGIEKGRGWGMREGGRDVGRKGDRGRDGE